MEQTGISSSRIQDFLFELLVVFIGVTAAFGAENLRESYLERQDAMDIYRAHETDLGRFASYTPTVTQRIDSLLHTFEAARRDGRQPPVPFYREPGAETPPLAVWEATTASGGSALIDTEVFYELALFYNRLASAAEIYRRYVRFGETEVVPLRLGDADRFYTGRGQLRPAYRAHLEQLQRVQTLLRNLSDQAETLQRTVRSARQDKEDLF